MRVVFGFKEPIHHLVKLVLGYFTPCETLPDCGEGIGRHPCMVRRLWPLKVGERQNRQDCDSGSDCPSYMNEL